MWLHHVRNQTVEGFPDARLVEQCQRFWTNDPFYRALVGESINVFVAPKEFPGLLVVHNGLQGPQPVYGTWTFPVGREPLGAIAGRVVNVALAQPRPISGALVQAVHCSPMACSRHTTRTSLAGVYRLVNLVVGRWTLSVTAPTFCGGQPRRVIVQAGQTTIVNVALLPCPLQGRSLASLLPVGRLPPQAPMWSPATSGQSLVTVSTFMPQGSRSTSRAIPSVAVEWELVFASSPALLGRTFSTAW